MSAALLIAVIHACKRFSPDELPSPHRFVLLALADAADDTGHAWPSVATIITITGQGERTVRSCLNELEAAKWIKGEQRYANGRPLSTRYHVRAEGGSVTRERSGRHGARGAPSEGAPGAEVHGAQGAQGAGYGARGAPSEGAPGAGVGAPGAGDPPKDPISSDPPKDPLTETTRAREVVPIEGEAPTLAEQLTAASAKRPGDVLIPLVAVLAEEGDTFGLDLAARIARGERLSHGQRQALERIRARRERETSGPPSRASPIRRHGHEVQRGPSFAAAARAAAAEPLPKDDW